MSVPKPCLGALFLSYWIQEQVTIPPGLLHVTLSSGQTCCLSTPCPQTPGSLVKPDLPAGTGNMEAALRVTVLEGKESHSAGGKGGPMSLGLSLSLISPPCQDCNTWFFIQSRGRLWQLMGAKWGPASSLFYHSGKTPALGLSVLWNTLEMEGEGSIASTGNQTWEWVKVKLYDEAERHKSGDQSWGWKRWICFKTTFLGCFLIAKDLNRKTHMAFAERLKKLPITYHLYSWLYKNKCSNEEIKDTPVMSLWVCVFKKERRFVPNGEILELFLFLSWNMNDGRCHSYYEIFEPGICVK